MSANDRITSSDDKRARQWDKRRDDSGNQHSTSAQRARRLRAPDKQRQLVNGLAKQQVTLAGANAMTAVVKCVKEKREGACVTNKIQSA